MKPKRTKGRASFKTALLLLAAIMIIVSLAELVFAQGPFARVGNMFANYAATTTPTFFDFFIFFIIFFALCWIGFGQIFKEAKNANIALSVAVGLALSVALVYGGKFTLKKLLPFAAVILFLLIFIGIYALLKKVIFTKDTTASKILSFVVAIIISIALLLIAWNMICSDYNCERNMLMRRFFGSESWIGKLFGGIDQAFTGAPYALPSPGAPAPAPRPAPKTLTERASSSWTWVVVIIAALLSLGALGYGFKKLHKPYQKRKRFKALYAKLRDIQQSEDKVVGKFRELYDAVKNEQTMFEQSRHIVDKITTDIKETIGGEVDFVRKEVRPEIGKRIDDLRARNMTEKNLIADPTDGILHHISNQLSEINAIAPEMKKSIDELEDIESHFKEHDNILKTFKQHKETFRQKGVITNILSRLDQNKQAFTDLAAKCDRMIQLFDQTQNEVAALAKRRALKNYPAILVHVRTIRDAAIRLNKIFAWKVSMIHYLSKRLKELQTEIGLLHQGEMETMKRYISEAEEMKKEENKNFDIAIYLALHVLENAKYLDNAHLDAASREELTTQRNQAKEIIRECIPKLFGSFKDRIQAELDYGDKTIYRRLIRLADTISRLQSVEYEFDKEFMTLINNTYANKLNTLKILCKELIKSGTAREHLFRELGLK